MLKYRVISGIALVTLFGLIVAWESIVSSILLAFVGVVFLSISLLELADITKALGAEIYKGLSIGAGITLIIAVFVSSRTPETALERCTLAEVLIVYSLVVATLLCGFAESDFRTGALRVMATLGGYLFVSWMLVFALKIYFFFNSPEHRSGPYLFFFMAMVAKSADIGGYFAGRLTNQVVGRTHKLVPRLSPKKSWEGFAGSVGLSIVTACMLVAATGDRMILNGHPAITYLTGSITAVALTILGLIGDLSISLLKRGSGKKDAGVVIPGFGGLLDVLDSLIVASPFFYLLLCVLD